jgi:hypothetical protein
MGPERTLLTDELPDTTDPVPAIAAALLDKADELADRMMVAYRSRIPGYANADDETLADARSWARNSITVAVGIVAQGRSPTDFTDALIDTGRRRARQGLPLHDVLLANLVATELIWGAVAELAPSDPSARLQVQEVFLEASITLLQRAVTALSAGYIEVEQARVADAEHDLQALVEALAGLRPPDQRHQARADALGIELDALRWCAVIAGNSENTGELVRALRRRSPGGIAGRIGDKVVAFLPGDDIPPLDLEPVGLSSARDHSAAYRRATGALKVALHLDHSPIVYEECVPLALVLTGPEEDREAFVEAQLGPLLTDPLGDELIRSLRAYYRCGQSVAAAARELYVHRHTLEYRLQRIEGTLQTDVRAPDKRLFLELALALLPTKRPGSPS